MKFSFIISSVDRYDDLKNCLVSIETAYDYSNHDIDIEIIVVFGGNGIKNKSVRNNYPQLVKFYTYEDIGLSAARNIGIKESSGDYLVFIDDDAKVKEDFLRVLLDMTARHNDVNAFCGRLIDSAQNIPFSTLFYNERPKKLRRPDYQYFMGSAHILSKKVIKKIGDYDERFGSGSKFFGSEESDMFFRLKAIGEDVIYFPELVFFHPIPNNPPEYVYRYAYAIAAMLIKQCIKDKKHILIYLFLILQRLAKACVRILQKLIFKGFYLEKDKKYHYRSVIKGTFKGINDFIIQEI